LTRRLALVVFPWSALLAAALVFLALQGRRTLLLELDIETSRAAPAVGQVWWTASRRPLQPSDSTSFPLAPGRQTVSIRLPVEIDTVQVRPGPGDGSDVTVRRIALGTPVAALRVWDGSRGFAGWQGSGGLDGFRAEAGALRMRVARADAGFQIDDVGPLRDRARRNAHARIAVLAGLLAGLFQTAALGLLLRSRGERPGAARATASSPAPKGAWWLLAGTTAACLAAAWFLGRGLLRRGAPPVFADAGEYSLVFVDHLGRRLSEKDGSLRLALDAHAFFRNAPDQVTGRFRIDAHGYRGGFDESDTRPRVLVLGGSAAFGFGLESDADVFTARLAEGEPRWQVVTAAVVGHLSGQELSELVHRGAGVAPSAVVALDGWNDLYVPLLAATRFPASGLGAGFNWDVFQMVESRLRLFTAGGAPEAARPETPEPVGDLVRRIATTYALNLREMSRVCAARGIPFLAVFQPWVASRAAPPEPERQALAGFLTMGARTDPALYTDLVRSAKGLLEKERIPFLDLHEGGPFRGAPGSLFLDSVHPNREGHRLLASEIRRRLGELLPPTR
jgi:lysophospholipase L1-like esterase